MSKLGIGTAFFILGMLFQMAFHPDFRRWDDDDTLARGDKLAFTHQLPDSSAQFYKNCDITFIAAQATGHDNVAFVLLKDCDFQKTYHQRVDNPAVDTFSIRYLKRLK